MELMSRRTVLAGSLASLVSACSNSDEPLGACVSHEMQLLLKHPEDRFQTNVFFPNIVKIGRGDSVRFIPDDNQHNCESVPGMIPRRAKSWKGNFGEEITVTFPIPGVYGCRCVAHGVLGMVGLVIVTGKGMHRNVKAAKAVKHPAASQKAWDALWTEVERRELL